jgi:DNA-binding GntR family transcriptional regulator
MSDNPKDLSALRRGSKHTRTPGTRVAEAVGRPLRDARRVHSANISGANNSGVNVSGKETANPGGGKGSRGPKAYQLLREAIATCRLKPGDRVLESELAAMFHMSRTPIREAIAALEADGLVSVDGARGRIVTKLDYQSTMELYAVREVLESTAAGLAARNASDMEIIALRDMVELEAQILEDSSRLAEHNRRFHEAIYYCSHNRYILKMLEYLQTAMILLQPMGRNGRGEDEIALREHRAIVDAIKTRDAAASEAAIRNHVRRAQQARIKLLLQNG